VLATKRSGRARQVAQDVTKRGRWFPSASPHIWLSTVLHGGMWEEGAYSVMISIIIAPISLLLT
jgi:hypothetical protein